MLMALSTFAAHANAPAVRSNAAKSVILKLFIIEKGLNS
jgi:hypothetical protein